MYEQQIETHRLVYSFATICMKNNFLLFALRIHLWIYKIKKFYTLKMKEWRRSFGVEWLIDSSVFWRFDFGINIGRVKFMTSEWYSKHKSAYTHILYIEYELKMWTLLSLSRTYFIVIKFKNGINKSVSRILKVN